MTRRGFTLLEVMIAVAILGLSLTAIFSSEVGAANIAQVACIGRTQIGGRQVQPIEPQLYGLIQQAEDIPNRLPLELEAAPVLSHAMQMQAVRM